MERNNKIRVDINKTENEKTIKTKSWCFKKTNKIDKPLARLIEQEKMFKTLNSKLKEKTSLLPLPK